MSTVTCDGSVPTGQGRGHGETAPKVLFDPLSNESVAVNEINTKQPRFLVIRHLTRLIAQTVFVDHQRLISQKFCLLQSFEKS